MGYTGEKKRTYAREWVAKRRHDFMDGKSCEKCAATENLHLHHIDPKMKISHAIWSWAEERRLAEIAKCQILCVKCHYELHSKLRRRWVHGIANTYKKGCRCNECLQAQYKTMKKYKDKSASNL